MVVERRDGDDLRPSEAYVRLFEPPKMAGHFTGKHVVTVEQFTREDMIEVFRTAADFRDRVRHGDRTLLNAAAGRVMATLFYEASTRTDMSFQAAMHRLGGAVVSTSGGVRFSSVYKGENLADTIRAVGCYADVVVLRHPDVGSSYEAAYYLDQLGEQLGRSPVVISGGDGVGEHPTQALLDLFTIVDCKGRADRLTITMVGDLLNGRTVHSLSKLIAQYGAQEVDFCFVSPFSLRMPSYIVDFLHERGYRVMQTGDLYEVLNRSDVIYWTRVQQERFAKPEDYEAIRDDFVMTPEVLGQAKSDAILMHPLPRKNEMGTPRDHDILDADSRAVYFKQMANGMFVRMALLAKVLGAAV
jgi:aspartate carbamoyltransferase